MRLKAFKNICFYRIKKIDLLSKTLLLTGVFVFGICLSCLAQDRTISGTVKTADGKALADVSIQIKGTTQGTVTDASGKYSLQAKDGALLIFSYTGYLSKEVSVGLLQSAFDVVLEQDPKSLEEVVVTAFGIERQKRSVGFTQQKVDGAVLTQARETNVLNSLKGRVAGVHTNQSSGGPSGSSYVIIRGNSSLSQRDQPLYVVDGIPVNNDNNRQASIFGGRDYGDGLKDINPDDIESISVLKGPNAAALYGSRGANGVILITTKKSAKKGLGISYNSNATFETINVIPAYQNKWASGYDDVYSWPTTTIGGVTYPMVPDDTEDQWGGPLDGRLAIITTMPELGPIPMSPIPNNVRKFYRTGTTYTNTLALTGGNENANMRLSLSNLSNKGIVPNNSMNRQTVNLIVGANITPRLKFEAKANYIREMNKNRPQVGVNTQNIHRGLARLARFIDLDWLKNYKKPDGTMTYWTNAFIGQNPYWLLNELLEDDQRDRLIGYVSMKYKFTDWLNLQVRVANDGYTDIQNERVGKRTRGVAGGAIRNYQLRVNELNTDAILTAAGRLSKNFTGSLLVGGNLFKTTTTITGFEGTNLNYDNLYHISNAQSVTNTNFVGRKEVQSAFYNGQLGFKNYLFLDITGRNDWSSALGEPSFFYPSFSLSHVLTDVLKIKSDFLSYVKLRASYAQAGNDGAIYQTKAGYSIFSIASGFGGQQFAAINQNVPNPKLKNELKTSYEAGADIRLFKNRVSIDFTYYNASTTNQIIQIPVSAATGFTAKVINAGEIKNKGIELFVNAIPVQLPNSFTWEASVNFSKNKSEVVSLPEGFSNLVLFGFSGNNVRIEARPGQPFGNIVAFPFKRSPDGQKVVEGGGYVPGDERVVLGNIQPDWLAGVTNTFSFRGIRLSALIDVRKGGEIYSQSKYDGMASGTGKFTENRGNLITPGVVWDPGQNKYIPNTEVVTAQVYYAYRAWNEVFEDFVLDASYVALREATLGYDFRPKILKKTPFKTATLSVVGRNLFYIYRDPQFKEMGVSPESAFAPTSVAQGYEFYTMPRTRSIGFNLSLSF